MSHVKRLIYALVITVALLVVSVGGIAWKVDRFMSTPVNVAESGATFEIAPGSSFGAVTRLLVEQGMVDSDFWYRVYARFSGNAIVQAGEYEIEAGTTAGELLEQFASGDVVGMRRGVITRLWTVGDVKRVRRENMRSM